MVECERTYAQPAPYCDQAGDAPLPSSSRKGFTSILATKGARGFNSAKRSGKAATDFKRPSASSSAMASREA